MNREELAPALELAAREALRYLDSLDERPVRGADVDAALEPFGGPLPEEGMGALEALAALAGDGLDGSVHSAGPRFFHFVTGGVTPAALGADWLASTVDQMAGLWVAAPLAARLESVAVAWLRELFGLPDSWGGILTTGATMANFVGLAAARRWWGERHGVDVDEEGLAGLPAVPVLSSGYLHASAFKALAMLGIGRGSVRLLSGDTVGRLDERALAEALAQLRGAPAIVVGNAGEVNAADFDPIARMADLAEEHGAWLHVDGAFGLFARLSPRTAELAAGVERAHSVIADGHKWLNVPYDCGFAFLRDPAALAGTFSLAGDYLPAPDDPRPNFGFLGPESSRRGRSLAVWATLAAYGRVGYRTMVERHLELARRLGERVDEAPDLERLAETRLNIVCFRYRPPGLPEEELDELNARLGEEVLADGRVYVGTTRYGGRVAFRPAIVNWRTGEDDVDLLADVVRELGASLLTRTK
ncbi:MAG TPA: aspartate aminotransferase family protein [Gaiellaceae bacterium]|nr:aspartate aminotransferase family protein [Gaiellaceae bacterium]